jgi:ribose transport system permease protein
MTRLLGVLLMVVALYAVLMLTFDGARSLDNHQVLARRLGFYGVLTLGVGVLIVSGGIDLSIGSLVGLAAVTFGLLMQAGVGPAAAVIIVIVSAGVIGFGHGIYVTRLGLQPFLVTLCGLFMYRGMARWLSNESSMGLPPRPQRPDLSVIPEAEQPAVLARFDFDMGQYQAVEQLRTWLVSGSTLAVPNQLWLLLAIAGLLAVFLHRSVYGRYFYAIGFNEQAAAYAGIATDRYKVLAYVLCSTLAGLGGVLFLLDNRSAQPTSAGSLLELYAITGAVLGGCSLRGGEGTIPGMLLGAAVLPMLYQICNFSPYIGSQLEYTVVGAALLLGTIGNELVARRSRQRAK